MMQGLHASTTDIGNDGQPVEQQLSCGYVAQHSSKQPLTSRNRTPAPALPPAASAATIGRRTARRNYENANEDSLRRSSTSRGRMTTPELPLSATTAMTGHRTTQLRYELNETLTARQAPTPTLQLAASAAMTGRQTTVKDAMTERWTTMSRSCR